MSGLLIEGNKHLVNGVETYNFTYINYFWIGAALMSVLSVSYTHLIVQILIKYNRVGRCV